MEGSKQAGPLRMNRVKRNLEKGLVLDERTWISKGIMSLMSLGDRVTRYAEVGGVLGEQWESKLAN